MPKTRILVVEDEGLVAADLQKRLEKLGYDVPAVASSAKEALDCARSGTFDLALMDIRLRGDTDGIAVARTLRSNHHMPVVYLTAHSDQKTVKRAMDTEPLGYLLKPVSDMALGQAMRGAIDSQHETAAVWISNAPGETELNFLKYRLEVIETWPESERKRTAVDSILQRLTSLARSGLSGRSAAG